MTTTRIEEIKERLEKATPYDGDGCYLFHDHAPDDIRYLLGEVERLLEWGSHEGNRVANAAADRNVELIKERDQLRAEVERQRLLLNECGKDWIAETELLRKERDQFKKRCERLEGALNDISECPHDSSCAFVLKRETTSVKRWDDDESICDCHRSIASQALEAKDE